MNRVTRLLDCFDRAVVINLRERRDRRRQISRELARAGMILGEDRVNLFTAERPTDAGGFPSATVRGCFESHLAVLRQALVDGVDSVLVLEDDLALARDFRDREGDVATELLRADWDIVHFGYHAPDVSAGPGPLVPFDGPVVLLHFYAVRRRALEALVPFLNGLLTRPVGHPEGGPMYPDGALNAFRTRDSALRTLLAVPSLGYQRSSRSDLHPRRFDKVPLVRDLAAVARRARAFSRRVSRRGTT